MSASVLLEWIPFITYISNEYRYEYYYLIKLTVETLAKVAVNTRLILSRSPKSGAISRKYSSFKLRKTSPSILCSTIFFRTSSEIVGTSFSRKMHTSSGERASK